MKMYRLQNILHEENPCNTGQHIYEQRNVRKLRMLFSKFLSHSGITEVHCAKFHNMRDDCLLNRLVSSTCYSFHTHAWLSRWRTQAQSAGFKAASDVRNRLLLYSVRRFRLISQQPFVAYVRAKHRRKVLDGCYLYGRSSSRLVFTRKSHNFSQKTSRIAASG